MTISLNVLEHLGIGLYSNIPAVLSEVVANAWDADATRVEIVVDKDKDKIVISDNGKGMTHKDINDKYLMVGYSKRKAEGGTTEKGRLAMGRKGIGKLSVFSIAEIVEVWSVKDGEVSGLRMKVSKIREQIENKASDQTYYPEPLDSQGVDIQIGTQITLHQVNKELTRTVEFLKKRLARRFSVIGKRGADDKDIFEIVINGEEITPKDRDFYNKLEFLWHFGLLDKEVESECTALQQKRQLDSILKVDGINYPVSGWIGTVKEQRDIDDENNSIVVFAHGKLVQEDILKDLKEGGVFSKYIIGEINADFMDLDDRPDIVTSDRQKVKETDIRYQELKNLIRTAVTRVGSDWSDWRVQIGQKRALENPAVKEWYERLGRDKKKLAERIFGRLESLKGVTEETKSELYKSTILAFEKLAYKDSLSALENIEDPKDFELLGKLFGSIDEVEAVYYYEIAKGRLEVIEQFKTMLPEERERVLQQFIFEKLWLLNPSWERAASNFRIEEVVQTEFDGVTAKLTDEERKGRIDIRYRTAAGKHIIIELKKYDRKVTVFELSEQLAKYRSALRKCLEKKFPGESKSIECIAILGSPPTHPEGQAEADKYFRDGGYRYLTYDTLIQDSLSSYGEYLNKQKEITTLIEIIDRFDGAIAVTAHVLGNAGGANP